MPAPGQTKVMDAALSALLGGMPRPKLTAEQVEAGRAHISRRDLECRNGKRSDRPHCGDPGSHNHDVFGAYVAGRLDYLVGVCNLWLAEGVFGIEIGTVGHYYCGLVIDVLLATERELRALGRAAEAEIVRLAVRAALAWWVLAAIPHPRRRDERIQGGGTVWHGQAKKVRRGLAVAVSGMRYTSKERGKAESGGLTTEDTAAATLAQELATPDDVGLTPLEIARAVEAIAGNAVAAEFVATWMRGTIETPDKAWRFRLRRFTRGAESVNLSPWPNPYKPCMAVGQVYASGLCRMMQPSPRGVSASKWGSGDYAVEIRDGVIYARCGTGEATVPEMRSGLGEAGELLWQVDVVGRRVTFTPGAAACSEEAPQ